LGLFGVSFILRILAAIVTFNRCALLARCLDYVEKQARRLDEVVVINNGSTDGTLAMLTERKVSVITQENVGSAGGWHRAIQYALDHDFDAVWLMDDDGFPDHQSLARLEQALVPEVACASSIVVQEDSPHHFVFPFPVLDKAGVPKLFSVPRKLSTVQELLPRSQSGVYPFAHLFNGALVSCEAVRRVGNVNKDFFIYGEEVDFFFRLKKAGLVISVLSAKHYHPDVSIRPYNELKIYFYVKNALVLNRWHYDFVWLRHVLIVGVILFRLIKRNGFGFFLVLVAGGHAPIFYRAVFRGLRGRIGKDFAD
jgi:rhamnopyranosyl-N-acetylglucosaminyl-diphospho-decaprenol beta-1,3/1,4-galactofuranosyltransferase